MEKRVITVLLQAAFVGSLLYACYVFHREQRYDPQVFMNFAPAAVLLVANILLNLAWDFISGQGMGFLSEMDPLTVFFLLIAAILMLIGLFMQEERFNQVLGWAFSLATFVAGFEAGKVRQRSSPKRKRSTAVTSAAPGGGDA